MLKYTEMSHRVGKDGQIERTVIVIDYSGSMLITDWKPSRIAGACEATVALIREKRRLYGSDEVGIVRFNSDAMVIHPPGPVAENALSLEASLQELGESGATNMTAGLHMARTVLFGLRASNVTMGRAVGWLARALFDSPSNPAVPAGKVLPRIILLSDGHNTSSRSPRKLARTLKEEGTIIDCIGIGGNPKEVDADLLRDIASTDEQGQPRYCFIGDKHRLIKKFEDLAKRLRRAD